MGKRRVNSDICKPNCRLCVDECPYDVLELDEKTGKAVARYPEDCHDCYFHFLCEKICPVEGAIEVRSQTNEKLWFVVE